MKTWRPIGYRNPYTPSPRPGNDRGFYDDPIEYTAYEQGRDDQHNDVIKHLRDNCGLQTLNYHHGEGDWKQWLKECFKEEKCPYIRTIGRPGEESMDYCELMDKPSGRKGICILISGKKCPEWEEIKRENE